MNQIMDVLNASSIKCNPCLRYGPPKKWRRQRECGVREKKSGDNRNSENAEKAEKCGSGGDQRKMRE